jgi:hypothetical protein
MNKTELKSRLHKIIDSIEDDEMLKAVHTILCSKSAFECRSSSGDPLTKEDMDEMIFASESDIEAKRLTNQRELKEEIKSWRRK